MKVYRAKGTYYEMQADAKKADRGFETVEFPFSASPKADFVDWLNERDARQADYAVVSMVREEEEAIRIVAQPLPTQPSSSHMDREIAFEDAFEAFPIAKKLHYAALAIENARAVDMLGTAPARAPQRYGENGK